MNTTTWCTPMRLAAVICAATSLWMGCGRAMHGEGSPKGGGEAVNSVPVHRSRPQTASAASVALVASPLVGAETAAHQQGEDWVRFLGPRTDGTSWERPVDPSRWNPMPPLLYSLDLGTSYGGPAVTARRVFQFCRYGDFERLTCYDAENGQPLWSREQPVIYEDMYGYNNGPRCSPVVDGDLVFTYGVAGRLTCYQVDDGKIVWMREINQEYGVVENFFGVASTPYVYKNLLLVMVGGSPPESQRVPRGRLDLVRPNGTAVVAFDKRTGEEVYRVGNDLASYSSITVRRVGDRIMGLAFLRGGLLAWNPDSGEELFYFPWRASKLESVNAALPVTFGNHVLLSETYEIGSVLLQVNGGQPEVVWQDSGSLRNHSFRAHWATPIAIDGYLYGCSGRNQPDADFRCIRLSDGEVQWTERTHERSTLLYVDGYLLVLGELGNLALVRPGPERYEVVASVDLSDVRDPRDGRPLLSPPCWAPPVLSHGRLFLRGRMRLVCLDLIPHPEVAPPQTATSQ